MDDAFSSDMAWIKLVFSDLSNANVKLVAFAPYNNDVDIGVRFQLFPKF